MLHQDSTRKIIRNVFLNCARKLNGEIFITPAWYDMHFVTQMWLNEKKLNSLSIYTRNPRVNMHIYSS